MDGILPLNKDRGMTSNDAVFKCRRLFRTRKVGHSGTLDPNVDGVLPICIGHATKVVSYLMESGKVYTGEVTLGFSTETEDLDGKIVEEYFLTKPFSDELIKEKMQQLCGDIIQIPPMEALHLTKKTASKNCVSKSPAEKEPMSERLPRISAKNLAFRPS